MDYFSFSSTQKRGVFVMTLLLFVAIAVVWFWKKNAHKNPAWKAFEFVEEEGKSSQLKLDINIADTADYQQLRGIGPVLSQRIVRYRESVGGFKKVDEIAKVWGLKKEVFEAIRPRLFVSATFHKKARPEKNRRKKYSKNKYPTYQKKKPLPEGFRLDINQADSTEFASLPGIGPVLSRRILKYRDAIRGFDSIPQFAKIYGLSPETLEAITPYLFVGEKQHYEKKEYSFNKNSKNKYIDSTKRYENKKSNKDLKPIDINAATAEQLTTLPGIGDKTASRILKYRKIIGGFARADMLQAVWGISDENYQRMKPFLFVESTFSSEKKDLNSIRTKGLTYYPFIEKELASRIISQRNQLGWFSNWEQVAQIEELTAQAQQSLKAYFFIGK